VVDVLSNVTATTTKAGAPSKANYILGDGVAERTKAASAEMLDKHPLYPGLDLA
jgi:glycine hydroxymethyltransferase